MNQKDIASSTVATHSTFKSYGIGFLLSLICTIVPFVLVTANIFTGSLLVVTLILFAIMQLLIQLVFFLHLGTQSKQQWNIVVLLFTALVVLILVLGTLWVMNNLNYNMNHKAREEYLQRQEGF